MNLAQVEKIARAVLYEGYLLYPYRPSAIKNQRRFNFGVIHPQSYSRVSGERSSLQTECLAQVSAGATVQVCLRFLQLVSEIKERQVLLPELRLEDLVLKPVTHSFDFPAESGFLRGTVTASSQELLDGVFKLTIRVSNESDCPVEDSTRRDEVLPHSLLSTHFVLGIENGVFVSLLDPPGALQELIPTCHNTALWPILVGESGVCDTLLCSPIILYDYPQIAAESPGDLFDATEIDEILSLRILTLTDDEKAEIRHSDDRARAILERTESLTPEHWRRLHGVVHALKENAS